MAEEQLGTAVIDIRAPLEELRKDLAKAKSEMDDAVQKTREAIIKADPSGALAAVSKVDTAVSSLPDGEVDLIADTAQIDAARASISALPTSHQIDVDAGKIDAARAAITSLPDSHEVDVNVDTSDADSAVSELKGKLAGLAGAFTAGAALAAFSTLEDAVVGTQVSVGNLVDESVDFEAVLRGIPSYLGAFNETQPVVRDIVAGMHEIEGVDLSTTGLTDLATQALTVSRTLDIDLNEAIGAVTAMMSNRLVPDAKTAFDMIYASSKQLSGPARDELISALTEYSVFFGHLGIDGREAMNMILAASDGSIQSIDKAGDSVKEFSIRAIDGSKATADAFEQAGLNGAEMARKIAEGGPVAKAAMGEIIDAILAIKDPIIQNQAAVGLFGTTVEDLGGVTGLVKLKKGMEDTAAPIASLTDDSQVLAGTFSGEVATAMTTVSNLLGSLGEKIAPVVGWFNDLPAPIQNVVLGAGLLTAGLIALGAIAPLVSGGLAAIGLAGGGASVGIGAMTLAAAPWLLAIGAIIAIGYLLIENWDSIKEAALTVALWVVDKFLWLAEKVVGAMVFAFGWVPGMGDKLRDAQAKIGQFRDTTNAAMDAINTDQAAGEITHLIDLVGALRSPQPIVVMADASQAQWAIDRFIGANNFRRITLSVQADASGIVARRVGKSHSGGMVEASWPSLPGLRADERPRILQVGEEIIPKHGRGKGGGNIYVTVEGSVIGERDLARRIKDINGG